MSTDDFTTAARAEAERVAGRRRLGGNSVPTSAQRSAFYWEVRLFEEAAAWARDHLAAQEPSDAAVEAGARALFIAQLDGDAFAGDAWDEQPHDAPRKVWFRDLTRAALVAARRDEEKR